MKNVACWLLLASASGCTTLGPMPAMTGSTGAVERRAGVELQAAAVPGFYLSSTTQSQPEQGGVCQLGVWLDSGELLSAPGLAVGGRMVSGGDDAAYPEPMLRYRSAIDDEERFTLGGAVFGTHASGGARSASYSATRVGGEVMANGRVTPKSHWLELHAFIGASALGLSADGRYCVGDDGTGVDCAEEGPITNLVDGEFAGVYPAGFAGLGLDFARHLGLPLHGVRLDATVAGGMMPEIRSGEQTGRALWTNIGLGITLRGGVVD